MPQTHRRTHHPLFWIAFLLIVLGIFLRFSGLDFDRGQHLHPDERFLTMVATGIEWPHHPADYFATSRSSLNPGNRGFPFYVYGDLPLFLVKAVAELTHTDDYEHLVRTGRTLAAAADTVTLTVVFLLAAEFFGFAAGLAAAVLYALCVLPLQLAHFFTCDPFQNLFLLLALYYTMLFCRRPKLGFSLPAGLAWGAALATKISALGFAPVFIAALLLAGRQTRRRQTIAIWLAGLLAAFITFRICNPYAFAGPGFFTFGLSQAFLANLQELRRISQPFSGFPPSLQWAFRPQLLYALQNMAFWGLGAPLALAGVCGLVMIPATALKNRQKYNLLPLVMTVGILASIAVHPVQTMRYLLPLYPLAAIAAAVCLNGFRNRFRGKVSAAWPLVAVTAASLFWALAFHAVYRHPMPRIAATQWLLQNLPAGTTIATEHWDDSLPLTSRRQAYKFITLQLYEPDTPAKIKELVRQLARSDYLIVSSNRLYAPITRLKGRFPATARYYEMLFGNTAGFSLAKEFFSYPSLGGITIPDDRAEEAFTVYDHPRVFIFARNRDFSTVRLQQELTAALKLHCDRERPYPMLVPVTRKHLLAKTGEEIPFIIRFGALMILFGTAGLWLSEHLFPGTGFPGRILVCCLGTFFYAAGLKAGPLSGDSEALSLLLLAAIFLAAGLYIRRHNWSPPWAPGRESGLVFWVVWLLFLLGRAHNPAIFWGERPMDFALLNAFTRTVSYPPIDPWLAGHPLHYYGWGQLTMAVLGRLAHIPPAYLYNLATALIPALAAELFYWSVKRLTGRKITALATVALILLAGNLSAFYLQPWHDGWQFADFWQASRIIPDTINEFPFWSALFGDLHAHFIAQIFAAFFIAALVLWQTLAPGQRFRAALLAGVAGGTLALTNAWSIPVYTALLLLLSFSVPPKTGVTLVGLAAAVGTVLATIFWTAPDATTGLRYNTCARLTLAQAITLFGPFLGIYLAWICRVLRPSRKTVAAFLGFALILLSLWPCGLSLSLLVSIPAMVFLWQKPASKNGIFLSLLTLLGIFILIGCDFFTLADHMNTIFKFYFEAWILFALAAALALDRLLPAKHPLSPVGIIALLLCASLFLTPMCCLAAWWHNPKIASDRFTLNGLHFLLQQKSDLRKCIARLNQFPGQPAIIEATGPPYGAYARISSLTGLPALLGWEYHVFQHGHPHRELTQRARQVELIYTHCNPMEIRKITTDNRVKFVYLGQLEKTTYGQGAGAALKEAGFAILYRSGKETVWVDQRF
jgi:YYY domain-containing protein